MKFVLSIDGGGVKGLIPAYILYTIHHNVKKDLSQMFDLVGGTSTGGIISLALSFLQPEHILQFYSKNSVNIFKKKHWWNFGLTQEKYQSKPLEYFLQKQFNGYFLSDTVIPSFVSTYDLLSRSPVLLKSYDPFFASCPVWEAARATSAAPVYFEPYHLTLQNKQYNLIDGGTYLNNPGLFVYHEAKKLWPDEKICLLSLGTGMDHKSYEIEHVKGWGAVEWLSPLLSIVFDGQSDAADIFLRDVAARDPNFIYYRFQHKLLYSDSAMDNTSERNIKNLILDGKNFVNLFKDDLSNIIKYFRLK